MIYNGFFSTSTESFKDDLMKECQKYEQNPFYSKSNSYWLEHINKDIRNRKKDYDEQEDHIADLDEGQLDNSLNDSDASKSDEEEL